jgi:hypothetical protein
MIPLARGTLSLELISCNPRSGPRSGHNTDDRQTELRPGARLPYGLEVWRGAKVLSVLWADDGAFEVASFVRGAWEDEALGLAT